MITIPDVKGKSIREAKNKFDDWGLKYNKVEEIYSFNTEKGKVVKTSPPIGTQVKYGDSITIYVSKKKTYPIFIIIFIILLGAILLGRTSISKLFAGNNKKEQKPNVCLLNCDTNGDGIADTNLDTDGDGKCDVNCTESVEQDGNGNSTDGNKNENPTTQPSQNVNNNAVSPKPQITLNPVKTDNGDTAVKVEATAPNKETVTIKYTNGKQTMEYFSNGGGTTIAMGDTVIINNGGTFTFYASTPSGNETIKDVDVSGNGKDELPPYISAIVSEEYANKVPIELDYDTADVKRIKVMEGERSLAEVTSKGKSIKGTTYLAEKNGYYTFAVYDAVGNGMTDIVEVKTVDNTAPTLKIFGDLITPKEVVGLKIEADDNLFRGETNYFTIYYTTGKASHYDFEDLPICKTSEINKCKVKLTNNESLGIRNNDTYTFIVYDKAGNYTTDFNCNSNDVCDSYISISNADSALTPPVFEINEIGWATSKEVRIKYPEGFGGEYSLDGGKTFIKYMNDVIDIVDDGQDHTIIARVQLDGVTVASSSINVYKVDDKDPKMELGFKDNGEFGIGNSQAIPKTSNINEIKSGANIVCYYNLVDTTDKKEITNLRQIKDSGYYDFECTMSTTTGKKVIASAKKVEFYKGIDLTFDSIDGKFDDGSKVTVKTIREGSTIGAFPVATRDGFTLASWYKDPEFKTVVRTTDKPTQNETYYAKWNNGKFNITLDPNGGTIAKTLVQVTNGNTYGDLGIPSLENKLFIGWYTAPEGGKIMLSTDKPAKSQTLYAHWDEGTGNLITIINKMYDSGVYSTRLQKNDGTNIRYVSATADNYIKFEDIADKYRMLGLIEVTKANGEKTKLIKAMMVSQSNKVAYGAGGVTYPNSPVKERVEESTSKLDKYTENVVWGDGTIAIGTKVVDIFTAEKNSTIKFNSKAALPYATDYAYSSSTSTYSSTTTSTMSNLSANSWLMSISEIKNTSNFVLNASSTFSEASPSYLFYQAGNIKSNASTTLAFGYYPVFFLNADLEIVSGSGTSASPYILK